MNAILTADGNEYCRTAFSASEICIGAMEDVSDPVTVFGYSLPDTDVSLFADDVPIGTAHTNSKTGKFMKVVKLPEKEE